MTASLARLEGILALEPRVAQAAVRQRFEAAFQGRGAKVVLFGASWLGRAALHGLRCAGLEPLAFADNDPVLQGQVRDGLPVLAPAQAMARHGASAVFIVTVFTNGPVLRQLEALGACHLPLSVVAWQFPELSRWWWPEFFPEGAGPYAPRIREAFGLLADEASREEFLGQLAWRSTLDRAFLPHHLPPEDTYFPPDLMPLGRDEVFVDCGACDGDTLRAFLRHQPAGPALFVGIEPDAGNRARLEAGLRDRPGGSCRIVPAVLGAQAGEIRFAQGGAMTSRAHEEGVLLPVLTLDGILEDLTPTLIKMDLEGAEGAALEGARATLQRCQPRLAIAAYHRAADLWELPLRLRELSGAYRTFLRRHADECWETVLYAKAGGPHE